MLVLGIGAGAGAGYGMSMLRSSYATASKLENTFELPVIGTISQVTTEASRLLKLKRLKLFAAGAGGLGKGQVCAHRLRHGRARNCARGRSVVAEG